MYAENVDDNRNKIQDSFLVLTMNVLLVAMMTCGCNTNTKINRRDQTSNQDSASPTPAHVEDLDGRSIDLLAPRIDLGLVFLFVRTDCPIGNRYAPTIAKIQQSYSAKGFRFSLIYPDSSETAEMIRTHTTDYALEVNAYRDPDHQLVARYGATITPEAVVLDRDGRMIYRGRIDNRAVDFGKERPRPTSHDLQEVLDKLVTGNPMELATTQAIGCMIE